MRELEVGKLYLREVNGNIAYSVITPKGKMEMDVKTEIKAPSSFDLNNGFDRVSMLGMDSPIPSIKTKCKPKAIYIRPNDRGIFSAWCLQGNDFKEYKITDQSYFKDKNGEIANRDKDKQGFDLITLKCGYTLNNLAPLKAAILEITSKASHTQLEQSGSSITEKNKVGNTALLLAVYYGHLPIIQFLWKAYPDSIKAKNKYGATASIFAAIKNHLPIMQFLLEFGGSSLKEKNIQGYTPLLFAAQEGHLPMVKWLWEKSEAPLEEKDKDGDTALLWAVYKNHLPVVKWLIEQEKNELDERYAHDSSRIFSILRKLFQKSKGENRNNRLLLTKTKDLKKKFIKRHRSHKKLTRQEDPSNKLIFEDRDQE